MASKISVEAYEKQLATICTRGGLREWPVKSSTDQHILMKSVTYLLQPGRDYSEKEINEALAQWSEEVAGNIQIDFASLRRYMVEAGYLERDAAGAHYRLNEEQGEQLFEAGVGDVDPAAVVRAALEEIEARRRKYASGG